ncbi:MAG TPA: hypothetical protein PK335_13335, partial [Draconibacterium sp.]|nr:hypothetical protein [Draconibacterium sp.]
RYDASDTYNLPFLSEPEALDDKSSQSIYPWPAKLVFVFTNRVLTFRGLSQFLFNNNAAAAVLPKLTGQPFSCSFG